ncbi:MAG TPA: hypothetical protein VGH28_04760 [Polyangiaceae bacterium]|jgi:hypothetical protein
MDGDEDSAEVVKLPAGRARSAWQAWLRALADDAEAALAAALTYEALGPADRDAWLDALDEDAPQILVPRESLFAPLLLVEEDDMRRARIAASCEGATLRGTPRAWVGRREDGVNVVVVVAPLWLRFVETLRCGWDDEHGFVFAEHDPLRSDDDVEHGEHRGAELERAELADVVEALAHAILACRRTARELPAALKAFAHLFTVEQQALHLIPAAT